MNAVATPVRTNTNARTTRIANNKDSVLIPPGPRVLNPPHAGIIADSRVARERREVDPVEGPPDLLEGGLELARGAQDEGLGEEALHRRGRRGGEALELVQDQDVARSEEHTSELQSH